MINRIDHSFERILEQAVADLGPEHGPRAFSAGGPLPTKPLGERVRSLSIPTAVAGVSPPAPTVVEAPFRPQHRPPVPVLTVLDDGSPDTGQEIRIRSPVFVIGRTAGDLVIPNDMTLSGEHAMLSLTEPSAGRVAWTLTDLGSSNRTFVRVQAATLAPDVTVLLGKRRFRIEPAQSQPIPAGGPSISDAGQVTSRLPLSTQDETSVDTLVDLSSDPAQARWPLTRPRVLIGRDAGRCQIHVGDPTLAGVHAEIARRPDGQWAIRAQPSHNGVWVSIGTVQLATGSCFQCGEQRFRFVMP